MPDRDLHDAMLEVIRERMDGDGVSGNRLAQLSGIGQTILAGHLRGRGVPTLDDLDAIASALSTSLEELLDVARHLQVIRDLPTANLPDEAVVLCHPARQWATGLVDIARAAAEESDGSTHLGTLRAAAGRLATDELAEERVRELVVHRPRPRPVVHLHPRGRHAAPQTSPPPRRRRPRCASCSTSWTRWGC